MPTYEYVCDACGHEFEKFQPITASASRKCPVCNKLKLRRLIGAGAGVIFKGSGFYQTDYRSGSYNKAAEADKPAAKSTSAKDSSAGKGKPASAETPAGSKSAKSGD